MIRWTVAYAFLMAMLVAPLAQATLVVDMDLPTLTREATHIVHADVLGSHTLEKNGQFRTEVQLRIRDKMKGDRPLPKGSLLTIELPGGTVGELSQMVSGTPQIRTGDEVVLFLWQREATTRPRILGLAQGAWRVERNGDRPRALRDRRGIGLVNPATHAIERHANPTAMDQIDLDALLEHIRDHVATERSLR